jgi:hypothetical protein
MALLSGNGAGGYKSVDRTNFVCTSGQTLFTLTQGYNVGDVDIYLNGVKLVEGDDYFAVNGTTITLNSAAALGDSLSVVSYNQFNVANTYSKTEADTRYMVATGGNPMTSYLRTPNYGVSSWSDSATASLEASVGAGEQGVGIKAFGRSLVTNGGNLHYSTDTRGTGGAHRFFGWNGTSAINFGGFDAIGRLTAPAQPCFYAYSDIYSPTKNYTTEVIFNNGTTNGLTTTLNVGNNFSASTGRFTAPVTGNYMFSGSFCRSSGNASIDIYKNGVSAGPRHLSYGADWQTATICVILPLAALDYVELRFGATNSTTTSGYRIHFTGKLES